MALDSHEELMLDVRQTCGRSLVLAPPLEPAQGDPERQEVLEVVLSWLNNAALRPRAPTIRCVAGRVWM
jgi:hypothetical protein